jgi:hypothetical protein
MGRRNARAVRQKCLTHLSKGCSELNEPARCGDVHFPREGKRRCAEARPCRLGSLPLDCHRARCGGGRRDRRINFAIRRGPKINAANKTFANFLLSHLEEVFTFLTRLVDRGKGTRPKRFFPPPTTSPNRRFAPPSSVTESRVALYAVTPLVLER